MRSEDIEWFTHNFVLAGICPPNTRWYLFGSILCEQTNSADFDILVLYEQRAHVIQIRTSIYELELQRPLDFIFMTFEEETELGFIQSESCVEVFPNNLLKETSL